MSVEVASKLVEQGARRRALDDDQRDAVERSAGLVPVPSTDALHAGAECGRTTTEGRSGLLPPCSVVAVGGWAEHCSVTVQEGHHMMTWSRPVVYCRWDCDCSNSNWSSVHVDDWRLQHHKLQTL